MEPLRRALLLWACLMPSPVMAASVVARGGRLSVEVQDIGTYSIFVDGLPIFTSGDTYFRHCSRTYSSADGSLSLQALRKGHARGEEIVSMTWLTLGGVTFQTFIRVRDTFAIFEQVFPQGADGTSLGDRDGIISAFPSLRPAWNGTRGVVAFQGMEDGQIVVSNWSATGPAARIGSGIGPTGPILIFTEDLGTSLVISPFSNFMAHSQVFKNNTLAYGVMGGVSSLPQGYASSTIVSLGQGINCAMEFWGDVLLSRYGKRRYDYRRDLSSQYLGYATDNGAYYYYQTETGKLYADTLVDVQTYAENVGIPYKYVLLDSWWYLKGGRGGVKQWDALPSVFDKGLGGLYNKTGWPQQLHNRYWDTDNVYAAQNGGKWRFVCDSDACLPDDQGFWDELLHNKSLTGMFMYEQDWLWVQFNKSRALGDNATLGRTWMLQMNAAAVRTNVTIQLCMSYVRNVLQSVEMPAVTNARVSGDYQPGNGNWQIGVTSILAHAVGVAPSKDDFWTTSTQSGYPARYGNVSEPFSRLHGAVASLSTGAVLPSDKIGSSDAVLISWCCDASGRLLAPDRPATAIDSVFVGRAFGQGANSVLGELWSTYAVFGNFKFSYVLGVNIMHDYQLSASELGYAVGSSLVAVRSNSSTFVNASGHVDVHACGQEDFQLILIAPDVEGYALLGEPRKWVPVSRQRFSDLQLDAAGGSVAISGAPKERVAVRWKTPGGLVTSSCELGATGYAIARVSATLASCVSLDEARELYV